jgi:transcriptional regulator with XRE-family HTH domain
MARHTAKFNWEAFGRNLREMREAAELGLREVARDECIDKATWCRAEQGKPITVPIFLYLCNWMNSSPFAYMPRGVLKPSIHG